MKAVIVTGSSGFVGVNIVQTFVSHGWHVYALVHKNIDDNLIALENEQKITILKSDITSMVSLTETIETIRKTNTPFPCAIVHAAAHTSDVGPRKIFKQINYDSVRFLGYLAKNNNITKFVFISSISVYGIKDFLGQNEDELNYDDNTGNHYARYKIKAEKWIKQNIPENHFVIIRPAAIWGKGDTTLIPRVVALLRKTPFIIHFGKWKGNNVWPFIPMSRGLHQSYL